MAKAGKAGDGAGMGGLGGSGNIDQIREILFGATQREQDERSSTLEKQLQRDAKRAADHLDKTRASLESSLEKLSGDLGSRLDQIAQRIEQVDADAKKATADTAQTLDQRLTDVGQELRELIDRLEQQKTGREELGGQLMELGLRLKGDIALDAIESSLGAMLEMNPDDEA